MAHFTSLKSVQNAILDYEDTIEIRGIKYTVKFTHLRCNSGYMNDVIFSVLNIEDKYGFCNRAYGYAARSGDFPEFKEGDWNAATRVAINLFRVAEGVISEEVINPPCKESTEEIKDTSKLLPVKSNIKQVEVQREITFNHL